jgi:hypothetical protein
MQVQPQTAQLSRILGQPPETLDGDAAARAAIERHADELANAFFHEAADSDDVTSVESAEDYLQVRLDFFGDLVTETAADRIRERFSELVARWER